MNFSRLVLFSVCDNTINKTKNLHVIKDKLRFSSIRETLIFAANNMSEDMSNDMSEDMDHKTSGDESQITTSPIEHPSALFPRLNISDGPDILSEYVFELVTDELDDNDTEDTSIK